MNDDTKDAIKIISTVLLIIYTFTLFISWIVHANDKAELLVSSMHVASRTEEYNNVMEQTKMLDEGGTEYRMNADSPVAALVKARDNAAQRLRKTKVYRVEILQDIISRCNGPWRPVVALVDNTTCAEYRAMKF